MTGNGRSKRKAGGGGGSGGQTPVATPCEELKLEAQLTSPQPAVVAALQVHEVLVVDLVSMNGRYVIQVLKDGQAAGGLPQSEAAALRDCIRQGHKFKATVLSLNGGQVQVHVEHA